MISASELKFHPFRLIFGLSLIKFRQLVCRHTCEIKTTEELCGKNLSKWIVDDLVGLEFNGIRDSLAMVNRSEYWPASCTELLKTTGYDKASSVKDTFLVC